MIAAAAAEAEVEEAAVGQPEGRALYFEEEVAVVELV